MASDFSLWFRFRFQFFGILPLPFYILHILHILYVIFLYFLYLSHSTFVVYSPNFGLSLFFVGNLIHSFTQLVLMCYTCICFAGCTNNSNNIEGGGIIIFTLAHLLLFFCEPNTFALALQQQQEQKRQALLQ